MTGFVTGDESARLCRNCRAGPCPSRLEGSGRRVREGMKFGEPALTRRFDWKGRAGDLPELCDEARAAAWRHAMT